MIKILTDVSAEAILQKVNTLAGSLSSLSTADKTNLVSAINEIFSSVGILSGLSTSDKTTLVAAINEIFAYTKVLKESSGAGLHNSLFRGKNIGTSLTSAQSSAIRAGTFDDLWVGDFWIIDNIIYRIADFDYYLHSGDTECTTHHVVVVPDTIFYTARMNSSDTTAGGYVGSEMYKTNLNQVTTTFTNAFGSSHILTYRECLTNAVTDGRATGAAWCNSTVELMTEAMVYGSYIRSTTNVGGTTETWYEDGTTPSKSQLALFRLRPDLIISSSGSTRDTWWLRNVSNSLRFANVVAFGRTSANAASGSALGVRPAALIY